MRFISFCSIVIVSFASLSCTTANGVPKSGNNSDIGVLAISDSKIIEKSKAINNVQRIFEESKHKKGISIAGIIIDENKISIKQSFARTSHWSGGVAIQERVVSIYFSSVKSIYYKQKNGYYFTLLKNNADNDIYSMHVSSYDDVLLLSASINSLK